MTNFPPIERQRLCNKVSKLLEEIITKEYKVGDRLPSETELAKYFKVSRIVLREAVKILAERGMLETKQGVGTFVIKPDLKNVSKALERFINVNLDCSYKDLYEIRRILEVGIAKLAAIRASKEDISLLKKAIDEMEKNRDLDDKWSKADLSFHILLAKATHNELFPTLLSPITNQLLKAYFLTHQVPGSINSGLQHHRNILEKITARDSEGAGKAMLAHLEDSEHYIMLAEEIRFNYQKGGSV